MHRANWIGVGALVLIWAGRIGVAQDAQPVADQPPPAIDKWVTDLESDIYTARVRATERLIMAGSRSIKPVTVAVGEGGLETISRGVYILRQLALSTSDPTTEQQAYEALRAISQRRFSGASRRAVTALQAVHEMRNQRAQLLLTQLGAVFSVTPVQVALGMRDAFPSIQFGETWRGRPSDFAHVDWITDFRHDESDQKWMLVVEGHQVSDEWLDRIVNTKNVAVLKFKFSTVSDAGLSKLATMPDLEILEFLYSPVTDAAVEHLGALTRLARLRLIGTRVTTAGTEQLQQLIAQADIDHRNGGFLGISCTDNPCRITLVQPDSAAAKAGFRVDDVITRYNDEPVQTMDELTQSISKHTVGDKIPVELLRSNNRITKEVELGAWD